MRTIIALLLAAMPAAADEPRPEPSKVDVAIERGLGFLQKDALAWREEHDCVSCHHAALVIWSMHEARQRGHVRDQANLGQRARQRVKHLACFMVAIHRQGDEDM